MPQRAVHKRSGAYKVRHQGQIHGPYKHTLEAVKAARDFGEGALVVLCGATDWPQYERRKQSRDVTGYTGPERRRPVVEDVDRSIPAVVE